MTRNRDGLLPRPSIRTVAVRVMCHNEAETIQRVVAGVLEAPGAAAYDLRVEVIDDGSTDGSAEIVTEAFRTDARVRVHGHRANQGIGAVLRRAFRPTAADAVVLLCGDLQFAPEDIFPLVGALARADLAIAARLRRADATVRRVVSTVDRTMNRLLLGCPHADVHWVRAVRGAFLEDCRYLTRSPAVDLELWSHIERRGGEVITVALPHYPRRHGRAAGARPRLLVRSLVDLLRLAWFERSR